MPDERKADPRSNYLYPGMAASVLHQCVLGLRQISPSHLYRFIPVKMIAVTNDILETRISISHCIVRVRTTRGRLIDLPGLYHGADLHESPPLFEI